MAAKALPCLEPGCGNDTLNPAQLCWHHVSSLKQKRPEVDTKSLSQGVTPSGDNSHRQPSDKEFIPRPEQSEMVRRAMRVFEDTERDRCKVVAACGMGKTGASQMLIDEYDSMLQSTRGRSGTYLVTAPTIDLAQQLRDDYLENGIISNLDEENCLSVHDSSVNIDRFRADQGLKDNSQDQEMVKEFLRRRPDGKPVVIFAVNDSLPKISKAQRELDEEFDLALVDEAHHLGGLKSKSGKKGGDKKLLPLYFNEQEEGIQAENRFFMTATPVYSRLEEARYRSLMGSRSPGATAEKDALLDFERKSGDKIMIDQSSEELFGETVSNYSYAYALEKGYLMRPKFVRSQVHVETGGRYMNRSSRVSMDGNAAGKSDTKTMSLGSYTSTVSAMDAIISQSNAHNALVFSNRIEEAQEVVQNWKGVAQSQSRRYLGGHDISVGEASAIVENSDQFSDEQVTGAKYRLIAEYASPLATSSKEPESLQRRARNHFDGKRRNEDGKECRCGQPGRWCACARVVSNVDMLGEGISIDSIDAVVLNRPSMPQDSAITQAMGRASRKWKDPDTNESLKDSSQIIVPQIYASDEEGDMHEVLADEALPSLNALSRTMRNYREARFDDANTHDAVNIETGGQEYAMDYEHYSAYPEFIITDELPDGPERMKQARRISEEAHVLLGTWNNARNKCSTEYKENNPHSIFTELPYDERCRMVIRHCMNSDNKEQRALGAAFKEGTIKMSTVDAARAYIKDKSDRSQWVDTDAMEPGEIINDYEVREDGGVSYTRDLSNLNSDKKQRILGRLAKRLAN